MQNSCAECFGEFFLPSLIVIHSRDQEEWRGFLCPACQKKNNVRPVLYGSVFVEATYHVISRARLCSLIPTYLHCICGIILAFAGPGTETLQLNVIDKDTQHDLQTRLQDAARVRAVVLQSRSCNKKLKMPWMSLDLFLKKFGDFVEEHLDRRSYGFFYKTG